MKILLFIATFLITANSFIDYIPEYALVCSQIDNSLTYTESLKFLWNVTILHTVDRIIFMVLCPFLIIVQIVFIIIFLKNKATLFKRQGTIFFAIILIQTTLNAYYLAQAVYISIEPYGQKMPDSFPAFCLTTGIVNTLAETSLDCYLLYFIIYTFLNMKTSIKSNQVINKKMLHISVGIVSIGWVLFMSLDQRISLNQFGLCGSSSLRYNTIQWFFPIQTIGSNLAYLGFAIYTYYYFKKHMPVNDSLLKRVYHENESISFFVIIYSILITLFDVSEGVVYFNCFRTNPVPQLLVFATVMNLSRLLQTVFLLYFIMNDHAIKKKTKRFLRNFFQPKRSDSHSFILELKDLDFSQPNYEDLDITLKQKILELKQEENQIDLYKIAQIATMIAGISIAHIQYFNTKTFSTLIRKIHFKERITFQIEPKILSDYNIQVNKLPKAGILKGTITMFAPRIFSRLLQSDSLTFVERSFDLSKNYHKMYNIAEGKGGKSGQFFFFSYDYKYVLKTVTKDEFHFINENLQEFFEYYQKNPQTLLAKFYGLYIIKGDDIGRQYNLILMKNIFGCTKKQIIRTYDIKGSKHDREVINQKRTQMFNQLESLTLKDTDFIKLQGKIFIAKDTIRNLRIALRKDTLFLKNFNLIDYSLLIIRVNWDQKPQNQNFWSQFQRIPSSKNPNQSYHIGLIDYMQAWNISKKSQNWFKSLMGKKQISAQQPNFYQKRFMQFVEQITYYPHLNIQEEQVRSDYGDQNSEMSQSQNQQKIHPTASRLKELLQMVNPKKLKKKQSGQTSSDKQPFVLACQISSIASKSSMHENTSIPSIVEENYERKNGVSFKGIKKISIDFNSFDKQLSPNEALNVTYSPQKQIVFSIEKHNLQRENELPILNPVAELSELDNDK